LTITCAKGSFFGIKRLIKEGSDFQSERLNRKEAKEVMKLTSSKYEINTLFVGGLIQQLCGASQKSTKREESEEIKDNKVIFWSEVIGMGCQTDIEKLGKQKAEVSEGKIGAIKEEMVLEISDSMMIGTQHNTTQHNTTQHNTTQHNTTQHNTTQHNTNTAAK
jgi:hypothetical protein